VNRIVGNVIIVDSAMGNAFILTSANQPIINDFHVNGIMFSPTTAGGHVLRFTGLDTTNTVLYIDSNNLLAGVAFSTPQELSNLKVPVISNGTAWIYLA